MSKREREEPEEQEELEEPPTKKLKSASPAVGTPIRVQATGRIGRLADTADDKSVILKLRFDDGLDPKEDGLAPDKVELLLFRDRAKGRIGRLVKYTPEDELSHKLEFCDGLEPLSDWFALDKIEVALFRVKADGRIGTLVRLENGSKDDDLTHKLKFDENKCDWFAERTLDEQPSLERLHERADRMRTEMRVRLQDLQKELITQWDAYKTRLQRIIGTKAIVSFGKILVGFIPGAHVVSEGASAASTASAFDELRKEMEDVGTLVLDMAGMYETGATHLESEEAKLLKVLSRKVRAMGEHHTGGFEEEPGKMVLQTLMEIKALGAKLKMLQEMSFNSTGNTSADDADKK